MKLYHKLARNPVVTEGEACKVRLSVLKRLVKSEIENYKQEHRQPVIGTAASSSTMSEPTDSVVVTKESGLKDRQQALENIKEARKKNRANDTKQRPTLADVNDMLAAKGVQIGSGGKVAFDAVVPKVTAKPPSSSRATGAVSALEGQRSKAGGVEYSGRVQC